MGIRYSGGKAVSEDGRSYSNPAGRTAKVVVMGKEHIVNISDASNLTGGGVTGALVGAVKEQEQIDRANDLFLQRAQEPAVQAQILSERQELAQSRQASFEMPSPVPQSFSQDLKPVFQYGQQSRGFVGVPSSSLSPKTPSSVPKPVFQFGQQSRGFATPVSPSLDAPTSAPSQVSTGFEPSTMSKELTSKTETSQDTMWSLYKENGKKVMIEEPRSLAVEPKNFGSWWKRLDFAVGGRLPGGLSKGRVADIYKKERIGADFKPLEEDATFFTSYVKKGETAAEEKARALTRRGATKYLGGGAIVAAGGWALGVPGIIGVGLAAGTTGVVGVLTNPILITKMVGAIMIKTSTGVGVLETARKIGRLQETEVQKEFLAGGEGNVAALNNMIDAGQKAVKERRKDYAFSEEDWMKKQALWFDSSKSSGVRTETFRMAARESLRSSGLDLEPDKIEEIVGLSLQREISTKTGEISAIGVISSGSELGGRIGSRQFITGKNLEVGTPAFKTASTGITKVIGLFGGAEGASIDMVLTKSGSLKFNPLRTVGVTAGAMFTAAAIGGPIAAFDIAGRSKTSKALLGGAYVTDIGEAPGDLLADWAQTLAGSSISGVRTKVTTGTAFISSFLSNTFGGKTRGGVSVVGDIPSSAKVAATFESPTLIQSGVSNAISGKASTSKGFGLVPTGISNTDFVFGKVGNTVVPVSKSPYNIFSSSNVPSDVLTGVGITPIVPVSTAVTTSTSITNAISNVISTSTAVTVPVSTTNAITSAIGVPIAVPTFRLPVPFVLPEGSSRLKFGKRKRGKRQVRYQRSLASSSRIFRKVFRKTAASKKSPFVTGLEIRL